MEKTRKNGTKYILKLLNGPENKFDFSDYKFTVSSSTLLFFFSCYICSGAGRIRQLNCIHPVGVLPDGSEEIRRAKDIKFLARV